MPGELDEVHQVTGLHIAGNGSAHAPADIAHGRTLIAAGDCNARDYQPRSGRGLAVDRCEGLQRFLAMVHRVSFERRMSRHAFVLRKPV
jgi:hypothetical protein